MKKSSLLEDIKKARIKGKISYRFRPKDLKEKCPGFAVSTYYSFLSRHISGKKYKQYFIRHSRGVYSLKDDPVLNERSLLEFLP
ncbi:hypothetical protein J7J18_04195 [bacterium]|nr:hypothetical protein [Methanomicrobia archaeon]MCD6148547.1 hypothetical protein [bacterium]